MDEYWIGKGVDYARIWSDYEAGLGYVDKFRTMKVHLLRLELAAFPADQPLFNHEAVYKTIKGYFHDLKELVLSRVEYESAGPLFLYRVDRGSGIWEFLGELRQLLMLGTTLADEKAVGQRLDNMEKRLALLRTHFGDAANPRDYEEFMRAKTPRQLERALQKLFEQGIRRVEISREPFEGTVEVIEGTLVDIKRLLKEADSDDR